MERWTWQEPWTQQRTGLVTGVTTGTSQIHVQTSHQGESRLEIYGPMAVDQCRVAAGEDGTRGPISQLCCMLVRCDHGMEQKGKKYKKITFTT
ncbi:hypothetical protein GE21DRAFT_1311810 [Neurospora crassa]|nr:hypothetical protein GE21DRAFT_1311810 [Neurospora crassa]